MKYINLLTKEVIDLDPRDVFECKKSSDVELGKLKNKITLLSINDYKILNGNDVIGINKSSIKRLIQNGYKPLGKLTENAISLNYNICPHCANEIIEDSTSNMVYIDCLSDFNNIKKMKFNIINNHVCCNTNLEVSTKFTMSVDKRAELLKNALENDKEVLIRASISKTYSKYYIYIKLIDFFKLPFELFGNKEFYDCSFINQYKNKGVDMSKVAIYFINNKSLMEYILKNRLYCQIHKVSDVETNKVINYLEDVTCDITKDIIGGIYE